MNRQIQEKPEEIQKKRRFHKDDVIIIFLVLNLIFAVFNHYKLQMTEWLLDTRAIVQVDLIKGNIRDGKVTKEQIEVYRRNWIATGYSRVAPVEILDAYQGTK